MKPWHLFISIICSPWLCAAASSPPTSPSDMQLALRAANELEAQGAFDAARRQLRSILRHADSVVQEDLGLRICSLWQRQGQMDIARRCYIDLATVLSGANACATARYRAAALAVDGGDSESGRQELTRLVDDLPYTDGARRAFVLARELHRELGGPQEESDFLLAAASRLAWVAEPGALKHDSVESRALLAEALVEVGRIRLEELHDPAASVRMLQRALPIARGTPWEDDALIWTARAQRHLGQRVDALELYHQLIAAQQAAVAFGVHFSAYYDDALYEVGQTLEEERRFDDARAAYAELIKQAPRSRLLDDAAYRMATLSARRGHDAAPLMDFIHDYPDSRHVRAVRNATLQ